MSDIKKDEVIAKIEAEISKIEGNNSKIYFFVMDTKGYPNSQLEYEYTLAKILKDSGYDVTMMYQERPVEQKDEEGAIIKGEDGKPVKVDPFVGVGGWLGEEYAQLPHINSFTENIGVSPADIIFIPEIYASVMQQSRNFPCKRIGIVTNYTQLVESLPVPEQWADYGVRDAIVPTETLAVQMKDIFPYLNVTVVNPYVDEKYADDGRIKDLLISVVCKDKSEFVKVLSPFYWKFPMFRWVVFSELKGMSSDVFANALKNSAFTVFIDKDSTFCSSALEAMKAGSIVIGKTPEILPDWIYDSEKKQFNECGFWTDDTKNISTVLANAVRLWTTDQIPADILEAQQKAVAPYTKENTESQIKGFIEATISGRLNELKESLEKLTYSHP